MLYIVLRLKGDRSKLHRHQINPQLPQPRTRNRFQRQNRPRSRSRIVEEGQAPGWVVELTVQQLPAIARRTGEDAAGGNGEIDVEPEVGFRRTRTIRYCHSGPTCDRQHARHEEVLPIYEPGAPPPAYFPL